MQNFRKTVKKILNKSRDKVCASTFDDVRKTVPEKFSEIAFYAF